MKGSRAKLTAMVESATQTIRRDNSTPAWRTSVRDVGSLTGRKRLLSQDHGAAEQQRENAARDVPGPPDRVGAVRALQGDNVLQRQIEAHIAQIGQIAANRDDDGVGQGGDQCQTENLRAGLQHFGHRLRPGGRIQILWHSPILKDDRAAHDFGFTRAGYGVTDTVLEWPSLDAAILLAFAIGAPRVRLKSHPEEARTAADQERYLALIERRARGEPLAYITGFREFWTLELRVTRDVLVPRPETELLVERALALCTAPAARVADLGTGSGAIALALAAERPAWQILGVDASAAALAVARDNAHRLGLTNLILESSNWFSALAGRQFDLLVSNPPYVDARDPGPLRP